MVRPQYRTTIGPLIVLLLLTLGVAAAITWVAVESAASHRAAAEDALRDDAKFAAAAYADEASRVMYTASVAIFAPLGAGMHTAEADRIYDLDVMRAAARDVRDCRCIYDPAPRYFFSFSLADHGLHIAGDSLPSPTARARLADSLASNSGTLSATLGDEESGRPAFYAMVDTSAGTTELFMMMLVHGIRGAPNVVYGFVTTFRSFADQVLPDLMTMALVPSSVARGLPNDSLLTITVRDELGREMYHSAVRYDTTYSATQPLWRFYADGPQVQVAIRPAAAQMLLQGGIPRSPLPLLVALLVGAGALVLAALRLARRAHDLAQLRADFTSSVSHELRTPLAQVLLFAESLQLGRVASEEERRNALRIILRETRRLAHLVDNILLISRTERRATHIAARPTPLAPIIREVTESFEPLARVRHATVRVTLDDRVVAFVDAGALRQILLNLLDNAVKYGPEGQTVDVGLALDGTWARIWVDDEGKGIHTSDHRRIWEPFVRLESGEYSVATGSGIGLSVVHQLVILHDGRCSVECAPSGGARFVVELPRASHDAAPSEAGDATPMLPASHQEANVT